MSNVKRNEIFDFIGKEIETYVTVQIEMHVVYREKTRNFNLRIEIIKKSNTEKKTLNSQCESKRKTCEFG